MGLHPRWGRTTVLADRMELFRTVFSGEVDPDGAVPRQLRRLWFDIAGTPFPHQVPAAVAAFGTGRLVYGSDYCWTPAHGVDAQLASIDKARQPANDSWRALTTRNATRLLRAGR
jgi:6-methylsalicylate decarboxylase